MALKIDKKLLTPNQYSRPQKPLKKVTHIAIHYVGNPNSSAIANRNYFESLKTKKVYASSHYIVGLKGEIIQCVPEEEIAYATYSANSYSISIENCHPTGDGHFNTATYSALVELCVDICTRYNLDPQKALIRHYDVPKDNGYQKPCPLYWVRNEKEWIKFKKDVKTKLEKSKRDTELEEALEKLKKNNIKLTFDCWCHMDKMNLDNVPFLLERFGGLELLVEKGVILSPEVWVEGKYKKEYVRTLIIRMANLCK